MSKPKAKKATKSKYEELPEIPDYERPELEKYEESDFNPSKKVKPTRRELSSYQTIFDKCIERDSGIDDNTELKCQDFWSFLPKSTIALGRPACENN